MLEKFLSKTKFDSYEDFMQNFKVNVPENFNFGYDVVDEWARTNPDKPALLWTNEQGEKIQFTFADIKRESDKAASFFTSLGIGRGDMVMLILKRRYQFWFSIIALHKIGATTIPATHLLTAKDIVYRCQSADIKAIVAVSHLHRSAHSRRLARLQQRLRRGGSVRASGRSQQQRRHLADVLYLRHHRRAQDGCPQLHLPTRTHHHRLLLAQPS